MNNNLIRGIIAPLSIFMLFMTGCGKKDYINIATTTQSANEGSLFTVSESNIIDDEDILVTVTGVNSDSSYGHALTLSITNKTNSEIALNCRDIAVDGYLLSSMFDVKLSGNSTTTDSLILDNNKMSEADINIPSTITLWLYTYSSDKYLTLQEYEPITIYTSEYNEKTYADDEKNSWDTIYEENDITIKSRFTDYTNTIGKGILLYIVNDTNESINITCQNMCIDSHSKSPIFSSLVYPDFRAVDGIAITENWLNENNIHGKVPVEMDIKILDIDGNLISTETISFDITI